MILPAINATLQPFWWREPLVRVAPSRIHRHGLFALQDIPPRTIVCRYTGTKNYDPPDSNGWVASVEGKDWCVDSEHPHNEAGRWCNHSLSFNARIYIPCEGVIYDSTIDRYCLYVISEETIKKGSEITINYGHAYFTDTQGKLVGRAYFTK